LAHLAYQQEPMNPKKRTLIARFQSGVDEAMTMPLAEVAVAIGKALVSAHFQRIWNPKIRFSPKFRKSSRGHFRDTATGEPV